MTSADRLRSLVKEATPAENWIDGQPMRYSGSDVHRMIPDGKLAALAPQLAELAADMADAAQACLDSAAQEPFDALEAVLRRLAALLPEDSA